MNDSRLGHFTPEQSSASPRADSSLGPAPPPIPHLPAAMPSYDVSTPLVKPMESPVYPKQRGARAPRTATPRARLRSRDLLAPAAVQMKEEAPKVKARPRRKQDEDVVPVVVAGPTKRGTLEDDVVPIFSRGGGLANSEKNKNVSRRSESRTLRLLAVRSNQRSFETC
jgi:hypothetical protein